HKAESTEARYWDGAARSCNEASVIEVERRGSVKQPEHRPQLRRQVLGYTTAESATEQERRAIRAELAERYKALEAAKP
ncbi:MAG: hypothetical protein L0J77_14370, partial [Marinobacter sp.]|nr:hypothetical protein [Marinobacter sp.]